MKTIKLQGKISTDYSTSWNKIIIIDETGYKIDLTSRFAEIQINSADNKIQVNYHLSDMPLTERQLKENLIKRISGAVDAEFQSNDYSYSSWTSGTDHDVNLTIGGHDLHTELFNEVGRYIFLEINYKTVVKP